uniref:Uncharacterized protein n=1 Tax=Arundo donax TaxID=35708 RepID=A0A0A9E4G4_ARUDO
MLSRGRCRLAATAVSTLLSQLMYKMCRDGRALCEYTVFSTSFHFTNKLQATVYSSAGGSTHRPWSLMS